MHAVTKMIEAISRQEGSRASLRLAGFQQHLSFALAGVLESGVIDPMHAAHDVWKVTDYKADG
jgi:hypothetical protein